MDNDTFYQNVSILTQFVPPSKDFLKHFKEGMFEKPNTIGFQHASHYLLMIYDAERFKKQVQWPLYCKKTEAKYRNDVKDFLTLISQENPDVDFPQILTSHLLHASGSKFNSIMSNLSTVVLRNVIKRETETMLLVPKAGIAEDLSRCMLNNLISRNVNIIEEVNRDIDKNEATSREYSNELANSIEKNRNELFLARQRLVELSFHVPTPSDMQKRLADPNDTEILSKWKQSFNESLEFLKRKQKRLAEIAELSTNVACTVRSIVSTDTNILDGKRLHIDVQGLSEIDELSPQTQVALCRLYENETLVLANFFSLLELALIDLSRCIEKYGFPDLSGCESQISASCEDLNSMRDLFHALYDRIIELTNLSKGNVVGKDRFPDYSSPYNRDRHLFDSVLLKSSPKMTINWSRETDGNEFDGRLELTPVENVHSALFSRHRRNGDATTQISKLRPKLLVSRINFDDTVTSDKLSPVYKNVTSRTLDQWNAHREEKYSRIFSTCKKAAGRLNYSTRFAVSSSRIISGTEMNSTCDVYNASELRSHLAAKGNYAGSRDISSPKKFTPTKGNADNRASSTIIEDKVSFPATELLEPTCETEKRDSKEIEETPKVRRITKKTEKQQNRRSSISDLVERYKKICDNSVDVTIRMNFSSDESGKD